MGTDAEYVLEMENITKAFPGVRALSNVQLRVRKGTVHGLMGENGAGKSTLMKCLIGIYVPDSGTITFKGEKLHITSTHYALFKGISMIHQELSPVPQMTVAENIYLGREPVTWYGLVDMPKMNKMAAELLERLHINIKPTARMVELSIAQSQLVEIAKRFLMTRI
jgi:inositol transport system ATP-binding protein